MSSILEELRADSTARPNQCKTCLWLEGRPRAEQAEWDTALADRAYTHTSIARAIARRKGSVPAGSVENHRSAKHRQGQS